MPARWRGRRSRHQPELRRGCH
eukprot:COSAG01_NODE_48565_length_380_cov_0.533808_1_plen_21_part_10